ESWNKIITPGWVGSVYYRVCEVPLIKPSIAWAVVHKDYNWLATDADGASYLYVGKPTASISYFNGCGTPCRATGFASLVVGTCDWKDSLVERPGWD
ncbi:unnamed protein product, partial [marine sediment metagenome]